jgi:hypothetical protein
LNDTIWGKLPNALVPKVLPWLLFSSCLHSISFAQGGICHMFSPSFYQLCSLIPSMGPWFPWLVKMNIVYLIQQMSKHQIAGQFQDDIYQFFQPNVINTHLLYYLSCLLSFIIWCHQISLYLQSHEQLLYPLL